MTKIQYKHEKSTENVSNYFLTKANEDNVGHATIRPASKPPPHVPAAAKSDRAHWQNGAGTFAKCPKCPKWPR